MARKAHKATMTTKPAITPARVPDRTLVCTCGGLLEFYGGSARCSTCRWCVFSSGEIQRRHEVCWICGDPCGNMIYSDPWKGFGHYRCEAHKPDYGLWRREDGAREALDMLQNDPREEVVRAYRSWALMLALGSFDADEAQYNAVVGACGVWAAAGLQHGLEAEYVTKFEERMNRKVG